MAGAATLKETDSTPSFARVDLAPRRITAIDIRVPPRGGRGCRIDSGWESFLVEGMPEDILHELRRLGREQGHGRPSGRLLRGQLVRAGLTEVIAEPVSIPMTDRATAETIHPAF